ncbi:12219_t:CDS:2, partial [Acaulospora morrowiae]
VWFGGRLGMEGGCRDGGRAQLETRLAILEQGEKGISTKDVSRSPVNFNDTSAFNIPDNTPNSSITPERIENSSDITSDYDTYHKKNSRSSTSSITIKTTSSEEKKINDFLDSVHKETISEKIREKNREKNLRSQYKVQKIMSEISENSSSINNDNIDRDVTTTTQDEAESLPSNTNFTLLYEELCESQCNNSRFKNLVRDHTLEAEQAREAELASNILRNFRSRFWERPETPFDLAHSANTSTRRRHRNRTPPPTYDGVSSIPSMNRREFTAGQRDRSASPTRRVPSRRDEYTNRYNVNNLGGDLGNNVGGNSSHNANDVGRDSGHNANDVGENSGHNVDDTGGNLDDTTYEFSSDLTSITSALNISASQNDSDFSMADAGGDSQLLESIVTV